MIVNSNSFATVSEYRKYLVEASRACFFQQGRIFAPNPQLDSKESQDRDLLGKYMRYLYLMPLGAVLLQLEVEGNRAIDQAISDGTVYEMGGIQAVHVQTETFSFYTTDLEAEGKREWLPFLLDEYYETRSSGRKQKLNQKALNLAFKKPLEENVVAEVDERLQRWLNPVLDMFRRHWECRTTIEGEQIMALYFEYSSNVQGVLTKYQGEGNQELRAEKIQALMDQFLLDMEEVRQTASLRQYTSHEIIEAARRAMHNFAVEENQRLVPLLGSKKRVTMFLEGYNDPITVYHTNRKPDDWHSPALPSLDLVEMAQRAFIMLAESDLRRSKERMNLKARETYAPVSHAEVQKARATHGLMNEDEGYEDREDRLNDEMPFGLSFEPEQQSEPQELASLTTIVDILATEGAESLPFEAADLRLLPYAIIGLEQGRFNVVHRVGCRAEATEILRTAQANLQPEQAENLRRHVKLLHDPNGELGAEGSSRLLNSLEPEFKRQISSQGNRYWAEWVVLKQLALEHSGQRSGVVVIQNRYINSAEAALQLRHLIQQIPLNQAEFKLVADALFVVHDPEGELASEGVSQDMQGLSGDILTQIQHPQYTLKRNKLLITIRGLDEATDRTVNDALADQIMLKTQEAKQAKCKAIGV